MKLRILISVSLVLLAVLAAHAQSAEDFFNSGAQFYISNNIPAALEKTEKGLKLYPDNVQLKKLEELLKRQQQSRQNQRQQKQNQSQRQQKSSGRKNQQQQKQQNQAQAQKQSEPHKKQQEARSSASQAGKKQEEKNGQKKAEAANKMTPQEARRLLDSQKNNEQFLRLKPPTPPPNSKRPIEDW